MLRKAIMLSIVAIICIACLSANAWASDNLVWPVSGDIIKQFSADEHRGVDISATVGTAVVALQDGVVYWVGETPRGEPCISIDHPDGLSTTYLPVKATVIKGQAVKAGDIVGTLSTEADPSSELPHLHFGMFTTSSREDKEYIDAAPILSGATKRAAINSENASSVQVGLDSAAEPASPIPPTVLKPAESTSMQRPTGMVQPCLNTPVSISTAIPATSPAAKSTFSHKVNVGVKVKAQPAPSASVPTTMSERTATKASRNSFNPAIAGQSGATGTSVYVPAERLFGWRYLPDAISVLAVLAIALVSGRFANRAKNGGEFTRSLIASC